jgi:hypothetical protein
VTEPSAEPLSLDRARLLLNWLRAQRAVDRCLSGLLAAGPAGERRVSREIGRVSEMVAAATEAFEAYRASIVQPKAGQPASRQDAPIDVDAPAVPLRSVTLSRP